MQSQYEKDRLANIKRNSDLLLTLGLDELKNFTPPKTTRQDVAPAAKSHKRKSPPQDAKDEDGSGSKASRTRATQDIMDTSGLRRSARNAGKVVDYQSKAAHLILRFASDAESDHILSPRSSGLQELVALRERGWEGLPPPPVFTIGKPKPASANQKDPGATPVVTSLGFPDSDVEPQIPQPPPLEPVATTLETDTIPGSPVLHSPSISITSLSDFVVANTSDDESPIDPTAITPHDTFYLEDGNTEVLCGNTLFRVHAGALLFHSPVLSQMFTKSNLVTAESPNGCPRILSSDTAMDFATLLKVIYLPAYATMPCYE